MEVLGPLLFSLYTRQLADLTDKLCVLLTGVILKGLTLRKFVSDICVCMFYVCEVIGFVD